MRKRLPPIRSGGEMGLKMENPLFPPSRRRHFSIRRYVRERMCYREFIRTREHFHRIKLRLSPKTPFSWPCTIRFTIGNRHSRLIGMLTRVLPEVGRLRLLVNSHRLVKVSKGVRQSGGSTPNLLRSLGSRPSFALLLRALPACSPQRRSGLPRHVAIGLVR